MYRFIKREKEYCPNCQEVRNVEIREHTASGFLDDTPIKYDEEYTVCLSCKTEWLSLSRKQMEKAIENIKNVLWQTK